MLILLMFMLTYLRINNIIIVLVLIYGYRNDNLRFGGENYEKGSTR